VAAKNACEHGRCGSCTVELDGELACACLVLAGQADGSRVVTAAGHRTARRRAHRPAGGVPGGRRRASAASARPGCCSSRATCSRASPEPTAERVREALAGNLCRCTGYQKIVDAVLLAAERIAEDAALR
jgi:carbon-monoxide dehydrogenase small subunit